MTKRFLTVAVAGLFTLSACGKDSTAPNANLSQAQVEDMMDAMSAIQDLGSIALPGQASAARGLSSIATTEIIDDVDCPVSGTVHLAGNFSVNDIQNPTQYTGDLTETHHACKAQSSSGKTWQFDGQPNVRTTVTENFTDLQNGTGTVSATQQGTIGFSSEGVSGQCSINLTINVSFNGTTGASSGTLSGTVCGRDVSQNYSVGGL